MLVQKDVKDVEDKVTLMEIRDSWENFDVCYGKRTPSYADAIMFDPNNSGTKLSRDSWMKIEEQDVLDEKIEEIQLQYKNADIHLIVGPGKQIFGYMSLPDKCMQVGIKTVDQQTLYVMPLPPARSPLPPRPPMT